MENRKVTLLVIDDDPGDIEILRRLLEEIPGWKVRLYAFTDAEQGRAELARRDVDVVLVDYWLGMETGTETLKTSQLSRSSVTATPPQVPW